ncbi:DUF4355 domain-containing protein [uncultured Clostridium sp.]|uniref:DUF4355 domain-containing protein n=1 Tax=uncultured Clostridium sp. TaxID=59620 RepID=UPI00263238C8|nr:DUF4355 domain-containing protein [uncultured Clostridium sp.]
MEENTNINVNTESNIVDSQIETTTPVATEKTFTQDEMDKIIAKRLAKEKQKAEVEKQEAERLAKLTAEERQKAEFEKMKSDFEAERREFAKAKMTMEVTKQLTEKELPSSLAEYIVTDDAETTKANIENVSTILNSWLEVVLAKKVAANVPSNVDTSKMDLITKEQFKNLGFMEQQEFALKYPDLYKKYL